MRKIALAVSLFCTMATYAQTEKVKNNLVTGTVDEDHNLALKTRVMVPEKAIAFNLGYSFPALNNSLTKSDFWNKKVGIGIEFDVNFRYQFLKKERDRETGEVKPAPMPLAIGIGLGFTHMSRKAGFDSFDETVKNFTDADGDKCDVILEYRNVEEKVAFSYLDIPLYLEIGKPSQVKTSAWLRLGFKGSILVAGKFTGTGTYSAKGNYPDWNVLIDQVSILNFTEQSACYGNPDYKFSPFVLWGSISGGVNFPFSSLEKNKPAKLILRLSAKLDYSLTPVSKALPNEYFDKSLFRINQSNMLTGDGSRILAFGISLGFIYCL